MTQTEEQNLFDLYTNKNTSPHTKQRIKDTIITHNMKFAAKCANTYISKYSHVDPDDIKGYAMMGLIDTVDRFDHTRGLRFTSYAVWWIKNFIIRNIETEESLIRYPANIHRQLQVEINNKDISYDMLSMINTVRGGNSIDASIEYGDGRSSNTFSDLLEDDSIEHMDDVITNNQLKEQIAKAFKYLTKDERYVMQSAYGFHTGEKRPLRDIADDLNVTHDRIRYIRNKSIQKLKKALCATLNQNDIRCSML